MDRVGFLRWGYGALALSLAAFGGSVLVGELVFAGILFALLAGALLAFSGDDVPRWAGTALLLYFLVTLLAFLAATPATIQFGSKVVFVNSAPTPFAMAVFHLLLVAMPVMATATATVAAWEREWPPRFLLGSALAAYVLVTLLTFLLRPGGEADAAAQAAAERQGDLLRVLFGFAGAVGTVGALWAAARPDEYA